MDAGAYKDKCFAGFTLHNPKPVKQHDKRNVFAIGGMSCCGKTSVLSDWPSTKVNKFMPTHLKRFYNLNPTSAHVYFTLSMKMLDTIDNVVMDRTPLDNIAYALTYYLMEHMSNSRLSPFALCEEYVNANMLTPVLETVKNRYNMLFIVDSNIPAWQERLRLRGERVNSLGDVAKSQSSKYGLQCAAFAYLASKCDIPIFDLHYMQAIEGDKDIGASLKRIKDCIPFDVNTSPVQYIQDEVEKRIDIDYRALHKAVLGISRR